MKALVAYAGVSIGSLGLRILTLWSLWPVMLASITPPANRFGLSIIAVLGITLVLEILSSPDGRLKEWSPKLERSVNDTVLDGVLRCALDLAVVWALVVVASAMLAS